MKCDFCDNMNAITFTDRVTGQKQHICPGCYATGQGLGQLASCSDIEDPSVQKRLLELNEAQAREDWQTQEFYNLMVDSQ